MLMLGIFLRIGGRTSDFRQLQGTWVSNDSRIILRINGGLAILEGFPEPRRFLFRIDPMASPKRITICDADGPGISPPISILGLSFGSPFVQSPTLEIRGIYEFQGHRLRICQAPQGADFPKFFDPKLGILEFHRP